MGQRDIFCGGYQNLEVQRQLVPQKKWTTGDEAVTQGQTKSEGIFPDVTPSGNRPGFLLAKWVAEQECLERDSEAAANSRRQHSLFAEHLMVSMLCTEELELPKMKENTKTEPEASKWADQRQIAEVSTIDQAPAVLTKEGQMASEPFGDKIVVDAARDLTAPAKQRIEKDEEAS